MSVHPHSLQAGRGLHASITSAMFWKFDLHASSHLEALLEKDDVTLTELMDEEDVLQECKAQNRRSRIPLLTSHLVTADACIAKCNLYFKISSDAFML